MNQPIENFTDDHDMDDHAYPIGIRALHEAYAKGLSPKFVVDHVFDAIAAADDPGIFISLATRESVRASALALGPFDPAAKPLWGIPFAVKDNIDVAGMPTTAAAPAFAYLPRVSAHAVERLIAAGALMIGKTNLDQFAAGLVGVRTPYPVPRNAIDPAIVPGGSSSGSAVAVARGLVTFALGTDTAGSGRVPAGLNNIVGLKPSVGAVSSRGVVPACRTLDCVSVFSLTVDDAWRAYTVMAGHDQADPFSRPVEVGALRPLTPNPTIGIPRIEDLRFFGDDAAAAAWSASVDILARLGAHLVEIDMSPFFETAALLYEGPWIAERHAAIREFVDNNADDIHPVTLGIILSAKKYSAVDAFQGLYRLAELKTRVAPVLRSIEALAVPTAPIAPTLEDLRTDPIRPNSQLGTYTNFVNLLDMCGISVPGNFRSDGRAAGITLLGARGRDAALASFALQELPHLACPIGLPRLLMQYPHPFHECLIGLRPCTHRTMLPRIEPAPTDLKDLTHSCHAKLPLMRQHKSVLHRDSLAKYRAAFFKMSRSSVTRASSRFSRLTSVVRSLRAPGPGKAVVPRSRTSVCHL